MLKFIEDFGAEKLADLFNKIYDSGEFFKALLKSVYIRLPKQPWATECLNFWTICFMQHTLKILLKLFQERISRKIDVEVGET